MNLYIDCKYGVAGDMLTAALLELIPIERRFEALEALNSMGIEGVVYAPTKVTRKGIFGAAMTVLIYGETEEHHHSHCEEEGGHHHHHHGRNLSDVNAVIDSLNVAEAVKNDAKGVYRLLADAESKAHNEPMDHIHFHEVGTLDAIADITAVCYLINLLAPARITASPIGVGSGTVKCAHGILPVPAPATANLLEGLPTTHDNLVGELCTPTGAALVRYFAEDFGEMKGMKTRYNGYGFGKKDFDWPNCVRVVLGESIKTEDEEAEMAVAPIKDEIVQLTANIDDMTAEAIGYAMDKLFEAGAVDVFTTPIGMKKNRTGTMITALCHEDEKDEVVATFFKHTTTIGIRESVKTRYVLARRTEVLSTPFGDIRKKTSTGYGVEHTKYEYDDIARIAKETGLSLDEVVKQYCHE